MSMGWMPCSADCSAMFRLAAHVKDAAVNFGMKRLHPAIQHFGKAGEIGDVADLDAGIAQQLGRAAGGDQFDAHFRQPAREFGQSCLVGYA